MFLIVERPSAVRIFNNGLLSNDCRHHIGAMTECLAPRRKVYRQKILHATFSLAAAQALLRGRFVPGTSAVRLERSSRTSPLHRCADLTAKSCISMKEKRLLHKSTRSEQISGFTGQQICDDVIKSPEVPVCATGTSQPVNGYRIIQHVSLRFQ